MILFGSAGYIMMEEDFFGGPWSGCALLGLAQTTRTRESSCPAAANLSSSVASGVEGSKSVGIRWQITGYRMRLSKSWVLSLGIQCAARERRLRASSVEWRVITMSLDGCLEIVRIAKGRPAAFSIPNSARMPLTFDFSAGKSVLA
jgi:hypothetical protein